MTNKPRRYFCLSDEELEYIKKYRTNHNYANLSNALSAILKENEFLRNRVNVLESERDGRDKKEEVMMQALVRNTSITVMMLDAIGIDATINDYHMVKKESSLLRSAREVYKERLEAARTKKSNGDS